MTDGINAVIEKMAARANREDGDYEKDGILYCGKCGEPKQAWIDWTADGDAVRRLLPVVCRCEREAELEQKKQDEREQFLAGLRYLRSLVDAQTAKWTFETDKDSCGKISAALRKYVRQWDEMKRSNMGILLYGNKGVGKSYYASCLVNAIEEKSETSAMVSTASLMATIQGTWERQSVIDALCRFQLLALDDLGAERDTSYSAELMYSVIDARYRAGKPTVVTTNIDLDDMEKETDLWRSRIYDRVIEMCPITIRMQGESKRREIADERKNKARKLLRGAANGS